MLIIRNNSAFLRELMPHSRKTFPAELTLQQISVLGSEKTVRQAISRSFTNQFLSWIGLSTCKRDESTLQRWEACAQKQAGIDSAVFSFMTVANTIKNIHAHCLLFIAKYALVRHNKLSHLLIFLDVVPVYLGQSPAH